MTEQSKLSPAVIVAAILVVVVIIGYFGWKTVRGGTDSERVPVDINKVKESFKQNGLGHN